MSLQADVDQLLSAAVDRGEVPGVIAMATDGRDILYQGAFGKREIGGEASMTVDTVCWIHSMTKAITATCLMQLVEQGRIGLDDDTGKILPAHAEPKVLEGFDGEGKPQLRPARGAITLRRLLTHTAGFVYDTWNANLLRYMTETRVSRSESFERPDKCLPLGFDPGTRWEYGINLEWAGKVLEAITGDTLDAYMQKNVLQPLGMLSTGYLLRPEIMDRLSGVHQRHGDGRLEAVTFNPPQRQKDFLGGGGLYGSAPDYIRFIRMLMGGGTLDGVQILKPETVALMEQNHIGEIDVRVLNSARPEQSNVVDLFPGQRLKWGLSFMINTEDVPGRRKAGTLSWAGLRNTYFWIDPQTGVGGTIMAQLLPFADPIVLGLYDGFERAVFASRAS
ncbi:MAG: serine hydrolase domain-containing protein [Hyphomicrobiaceae bacterium]